MAADRAGVGFFTFADSGPIPVVLQRLIASLLAVSFAAACTSAPPGPPSRPPTPAGWTTITVDAGDLRMTLPPWLVPFDSTGALFANEPPAPGAGGFLELIAEGPRTAAPQPGIDERLDEWLWRKIGPRVDRTGGVVREIHLPAGPGGAIDLVRLPGTAQASRLAAYAIRTPAGVAFLLIDGPPAAWAAHEADVSLIPLLLELGPGQSG